MDVKGRVAVVTGGGSGLGRAAVLALAERGARIAVLDRDGARAQLVADDTAGEALPIEVDVSDESSVDRAMSEVASAFGGVHVLVNAAGVHDGRKIVAHGKAMALSDFRRLIDINLVGTFDVMRRCVEQMIVNEPDEGGERGVVVNVSSVSAWQGRRGQAAYAASKAGVIGMMLAAARDVAEFGVRVVTVAPGLFDTGLTGEVPERVMAELGQMTLNPKRVGEPAEFAALVNHVVDNRYLNATTISIDAGLRVH